MSGLAADERDLAAEKERSRGGERWRERSNDGERGIASEREV